jgi:t-SNARE complex subunit (syntaxin)
MKIVPLRKKTRFMQSMVVPLIPVLRRQTDADLRVQDELGLQRRSRTDSTTQRNPASDKNKTNKQIFIIIIIIIIIIIVIIIIIIIILHV